MAFTFVPGRQINMREETIHHIQQIIEAAILASGKPLSIDRLIDLFAEGERPPRQVFEHALIRLEKACEDRAYSLQKVASGYRFQIRQTYAPWVSRLFEEKPQRYSRALLETLALIVYRQPITRGEIEEIRGVAVSSNIVRTLMEREWIRVVGHKDVPGRPAMYATTRQFLDYFSLTGLSQMPPLSDIRDIDEIGREVEQKMQAEIQFEPSQEEPATSEAGNDPEANATDATTTDATTPETTTADITTPQDNRHGS